MAEPTQGEQETLVDAYIGAVAADLRAVGIQVRDWSIEVDEHLEGYIDVGDVDPDDGTCLALAWREHLGWYLIRTKPHEAPGDHWGDLDCALLAEPPGGEPVPPEERPHPHQHGGRRLAGAGMGTTGGIRPGPAPGRRRVSDRAVLGGDLRLHTRHLMDFGYAR